MTPFPNNKNLCTEERQKIIVSTDNGSHNPSRHIAHNVDGDIVYRYSVEGDLINGDGQKRCDYLLLNKEKQNAYLIELKGSKVIEAREQILQSERVIRDYLKGYRFLYRIIYRTGTHDVAANQIIRWKEVCQKETGKGVPPKLVIKQKEYTEDI